MLHYKACARTWKQKAADIALGVFGVVAAVYTTVQTIVVSMIPLLPWLCLTFLNSSWHNRAQRPRL